MQDATAKMTPKSGGQAAVKTVRRRALGDDRGQALVELAVGLGVFAILLAGGVEYGRLAYAGTEVTDAARAGVQYGAQSSTTATDTSGIQLAATQDAPDVTGMTATSKLVCVCSDGSASTCAGTDCLTSRMIESVQVNTSATVTTPLHVPGLPTSYTLTGQAVMRVGQ